MKLVLSESMLLSHTTLHRKSTLYGVFRPGSTEDILSTVNHPTLRSRVELFNENYHAISIHGPRTKSMIRTERVSAVQPRRVNNLSALHGQFFLFFLAKNMRIKKMTSLDYNN